jgi:DNA modification methylase
MPETTILIGDVRDRIKEIPDDSVNCVVTSPPYFFGFRDYGTGTWTGGNNPNCEHVRHQRAKVPQGLQGRTAREAGQREAIEHGLTPPEDIHNRYPSAGKAIGNGQFVCELCGAIKVDKQIGLEISPEEYVDAMVEVSREIKRVLRPDGIYWLEHRRQLRQHWRKF